MPFPCLDDIRWATQHLERYIELLASNPWTSWKHVDDVRKKQAQVAGAVTARQLLEHFKASMEAPPTPPTDRDPAIHVPHAHLVDISSDDFTMDELKRALSTMKGHTASGPDGIPIEAYRCAKVQADLLSFLNATLDVENLPELLMDATLTPIYKKKGNAREPVNYRPIVLLSVALKILHKMFLLRLRDKIDKFLIPCQAAYREGHATTMNMATLQELAEICKKSKNTALYEVFTDFSAAFDSVHRPHLFKLLRKWNVPDRLVSFLERSHAQQRLRVRFDGTTTEESITPTRGVMQGDTLAPYLFILVIDQILRQLPVRCGALVHEQGTTTRDCSVRICALAYADDVVLLANTRDNAQELLLAFESAALDWGLRLNTKKGKTELLIAASDEKRSNLPAEPISCKAGVVLETSEYRYLGWHVSNSTQTTWKQDFGKRQQHAWAVLRQHERIWKSNVDVRVKKKLFQALIIPVLLYAAITYPMTQAVLLYLHVATNKLMRRALGLRVEWNDPSLHTHTEDLYDLFAFSPVSMVRLFCVQWGHWCRAAHATDGHHPIVDAFLHNHNHVKRSRGVPHPPSKWLMAATGCNEQELWDLPVHRDRWSKLCKDRTFAMAQDFCDSVVTNRRLADDRPLPAWNSLIDRWFDEERATRRKGFF